MKPLKFKLLPVSILFLLLSALNINAQISEKDQAHYDSKTSEAINEWTGSVNHNWTNSGNWSLGSVPISSDDVIIPGGTPNQPFIYSGTTATCNDIVIQSGAVLTQEGTSYFRVYRHFNSDNGQFVMSSVSSYLYFDGTSSNYWDDDNMNDIYSNVRVDKDLSTATTTMWQDMTLQGGAYSAFSIREGEFAIDAEWELTVLGTTDGALTVENGGKLTLDQNQDVTVSGGIVFEDGSQLENIQGSIRCGGNFRVEANAAYDIHFGYNSWLFMNGSGDQYIQDLDGGTLRLSGLYINKPSGTCYIANEDLYILGALNILMSSELSCKSSPSSSVSHDIYIGFYWGMGDSGSFDPADGRVIFFGNSPVSEIAAPVTFNELEIAKDPGTVLEISRAVECARLDWTSGDIILTTASMTAGSLTANDLVDNGIYGSYTLNPGTEANLTNPDGFVDLNGSITFNGGGIMNVYGGTSDSYWSYAADASLTMNGGTLSFHDRGIRLHDGSHSLTINMSGGTIRTARGFYGNSPSFAPTGGAVECFTAFDGSLELVAGNHFHNLIINKSAKSGSSGTNPKSVAREGGPPPGNSEAYTMDMASDLDINGDLEINNGILNTGTFDIYIAGDWTNNAGAAAFNEVNNLVVFDGNLDADIHTGETFWNLSVAKTQAGFDALELMDGITLNVSHDLNINDGGVEMNPASTLVVGNDFTLALNAGLNMYGDTGIGFFVGGDWTNHNTTYSGAGNGFHPGTGNGTVCFNGSGDQFLTTAAPQEEFYHLVIDKSDSFKPYDALWVYGDLMIQNGIFGYTTYSGLNHFLFGDVTVASTGEFYPANTVTFKGASDQIYEQIGVNNGFFRGVVVDKTVAESSYTPGKDEEGPVVNVQDGGTKSQTVTLNSYLIILAVEGSLSVEEGTLDVNSNQITITPGNIDVNDGGTLSVGPGGTLRLEGGRSLNVNNGGILELTGASGNECNVRRNNSGYYSLNINSGGTISAEYTIFENTTFDGVEVYSGATIDPVHSFNHCTFRDGADAFGSAFLTINNSQDVVIEGAQFPDAATAQFNVAKDADAGTVTLNNVSGGFAGPAHEYDPYGRIFWSDFPPGLWTGAVSSNWHDPDNWADLLVPNASTDVTIPSGVPNYPNVSVTDGNCNSLVVESGAMITVGAVDLNIATDMTIHGNLTMNNTASRVYADGNVVWESGSTAGMTGSARIVVEGNWNFQPGANVQLTSGYVEFSGSTDAWIRSFEASCHFNHLNANKTGAFLSFSDLSTQPLHIHGNLYNYSGCTLYAPTSYDIVLGGFFNNLGGLFRFNQNWLGGNGAFIFNGPGSATGIKPTPGSYFENLVINSTGAYAIDNAFSDSLVIRNDLWIETGVLNSNDHTITIGGDWTNDVGDAGFGQGTGTVLFNGDDDQYCNSEVFANLIVDKTAGELIFPAAKAFGLNPKMKGKENTDITPVWLDNMKQGLEVENQEKAGVFLDKLLEKAGQGGAKGTTECDTYDWAAGAIHIDGGTFTAWEMIDDGFYGTIVISGGEANFHQGTGAGEYIDLNGDLTISGGTMNVHGGYDRSYWPYNNDASITMSDGILDFHDKGVLVYNTGLNLIPNITGGTIRVAQGFAAERADWTPSAGAVELYGGADALILTVNGASFYDVVISKTGGKGGTTAVQDRNGTQNPMQKANTVLAGSDLEITHDLNIDAGTFNVNGHAVYVDYAVNVSGTLMMTNVADELHAFELLWKTGSYSNINNGSIHLVNGNWFNNGTHAMITAGNTMYFESPYPVSALESQDPDATVGNVHINKSNGDFYLSALSTQPVNVAGNMTVAGGNTCFGQGKTLIVQGVMDIQDGAEYYIPSMTMTDELPGEDQSGLTGYPSVKAGGKGGYFETGSDFTLNGLLHVGNGDALVHGMFELGPTGELTIDGGSFIVDAPYAKSKAWQSMYGILNLSSGLFEITNNSILMESGFTDNISGGTIRCGFSFSAPYPGVFEPSGNILELTGIGNPYILCDDGNYFNNLIINRSAHIVLDSDITITDDLEIQAGTLNSFYGDNHDIYVGGNWTNNVGDAGFGEAAGKVEFIGNNPSDLMTDETFYNFVLNKTIAAFDGFELMDNKTMNITNDLTITDGTLEMNQNSAINVDGDVEIALDAGLNAYGDTGLNINVGGDWTNHNIAYNTITGFSPGTSTVTFNGLPDQYLTTGASQEEFFNLVIDKAGNSFKPNDNLWVWGNLDVLNGTFGNNSLTLSHYLFGNVFIDDPGYFLPGGVLTFKGTADQTFEHLGANTGSMLFVVIDKTSAKSAFAPEPDGEGSSVNYDTGGSKSQTVVLNSKFLVLGIGSLTVDEGTIDVNSNYIRTHDGDININDGGIITVGPNGFLDVGSNTTCNVNTGGLLELIGTGGNEAMVSRQGSEYYDLNVNAGGTISAEHVIFEYTGYNGVFVDDGAMVDPVHSFNHCTFRNGSPLSGAGFLVINNNQDLIISGADFPDDASADYNVIKELDHGSIEMDAASGIFAGEPFDGDPFDRIIWTGSGFQLDLKAWLEGPFNGASMNTTLNTGGYIPLAQPYNQPPWNYMGTEAVASIPNINVTDWILIELRDAPDAASANSATMISQQAAFLLNDGSVVNTDGSSILQFSNVTIQHSLFAVLWHRNHIGIMSAVPLTEAGGIYSYDFTTDAGQVHGSSLAHKQIATGIWGMAAGDGNADGQINNGDKNDVWAVQAGASGYMAGDFNMDSQVNNGDKNDLWVPNTGMGGQVPDDRSPKCYVPE